MSAPLAWEIKIYTNLFILGFIKIIDQVWGIKLYSFLKTWPNFNEIHENVCKIYSTVTIDWFFQANLLTFFHLKGHNMLSKCATFSILKRIDTIQHQSPSSSVQEIVKLLCYTRSGNEIEISRNLCISWIKAKLKFNNINPTTTYTAYVQDKCHIW